MIITVLRDTLNCQKCFHIYCMFRTRLKTWAILQLEVEISDERLRNFRASNTFLCSPPSLRATLVWPVKTSTLVFNSPVLVRVFDKSLGAKHWSSSSVGSNEINRLNQTGFEVVEIIKPVALWLSSWWLKNQAQECIYFLLKRKSRLLFLWAVLLCIDFFP